MGSSSSGLLAARPTRLSHSNRFVGRVPPIQAAHRWVLHTIHSLNWCSVTMSAMARRPPGRSTRPASRKTRALSEARLITPLEITTSKLASSKANSSMRPSEEHPP